MAGLLEGEGAIVINETFGKVSVAINMTDEDVIRRFAMLVGRQNHVHYRLPAKACWKASWLVSVSSRRDAVILLEAMLPWFGQRRAMRAREALLILAEHGATVAPPT